MVSCTYSILDFLIIYSYCNFFFEWCQSTSADDFDYYFFIWTIKSSSIQILVRTESGFAIDQFAYSIIYGSPQYLISTQDEYLTLGPLTLFSVDSRTKMAQVGLSAIIGYRNITIDVQGAILLGEATTSTYRTGSACTSCQTHMYSITGQMNCQQCGPYCGECSGTATNCNLCNTITYRINPPNCAQCPDQMFMQIGVQICQQCANYCGQCAATYDNCTICLASTNRIYPPNCTICQSQYFLITNILNCQPCFNYCNECSSTADHCHSCLASSLRTNPPNCVTCPSQYFVKSNQQNCQQCPIYCNNCQNYTSQCIACSTNSLRLNPPNCIDCPQFTYFNGNTCTQCYSSCQTCNSQKCLTCLTQQYINYSGQCINCPQHCLACDINKCYACAGDCLQCNFTSCLKCKSDNYYISGTTCIECPQNCSTCDATQCFTCNGPRIPINNQCQCKPPCQTCDQNQCLSCISSDYRIQGLTCQFCPLACVACDSQGNCYKEPINCQEGNYIDSSIIKCIQCQSNYYLSNNSCIQCSPQCLKCNYQPHQCTICRFINLIQQGCILCESLPGLYSDYLTNTCYSICGDGILSATEQCDDGNDNTLDGCSNCQIDPGYYCLGLMCEVIKYPIPTIIQNLTVNSVYNPYRQFYLSYNTPLVSQTMNIEIQINNLTYTQFNLTQIDREQFSISLLLSEQIIGAEFQVIFLNIDQITSDLGYKQQIKIVKCLVSDYLMINPTDKDISDSTNTIMQYLFIILYIIISLSILFGGLELCWSLLDLLQTISYLAYINTIKPYYLYTFLNLFDFLQFQNLPLTWLFNTQNWVQNILNLNQFQQPPELINVGGYTTSSIMNILPIINVLFIGILIYLIALIILSFMQQNVFSFNPNYLIRNIKMSKILYNLKYFINKTCDNITEQWIWSGLIRIFLSSAYEISFAICLGIYGLQYQIDSVTVTIDLIVTIIITLSYLFVILLISIIGSFKGITLKLKEDEYSAVYEGLKLKNTFAKQYNTLLLIKKLLFMASLVLLYNEPLYQILNIIFAQITQLLILIIIDPLQNKKDRLKQVICDISMLIAEIQLLILVIDDYWALFIHENRRIFGWICLFALVNIIICQLLLDAYQQGIYYYKRYFLFRKWVDSLKNRIFYKPVINTRIQDMII